MGVTLSILLSVAALALFALAMTRHHRQAFGRRPTPGAKRAYSVAGAVTIALSPVPWIVQTSPAMALVTWLFCGVPLAALVVVAAFTALGLKARG